MKVITGVEEYELKNNEVGVFLAGGITNCPNWQNKVINELKAKEDTNRLCIFNPRRDNFPIHDPNVSEEQIKWEFNWLEKVDIFSMYFSSGESLQPICMYELGRNILHIQNRFPDDWEKRILISSEKGYKRINDVIIQTKLATNDKVFVIVRESLEDLVEVHARLIYKKYKEILNKNI